MNDKPETLNDILAEMEMGNTCDFPFAYRVGMPDEPEVVDVTGAIIKPRVIRIKNVTVEELVDRIKAARERERGDTAAMREALAALQARFERNVMAYQDRYFKFTGWHWTKKAEEAKRWRDVFSELNEQCKAALAAPPRECDVGTAEEQEQRFLKFCLKDRPCAAGGGVFCAFECPLNTIKNCGLKWAQMPYDAANESEAK